MSPYADLADGLGEDLLADYYALRRSIGEVSFS